MYKLILFLLLCSFVMTMSALQIDQELAMHALFNGKHAVNRAAHAAAQQLDQPMLSRGVYTIDPARAYDAALEYLRHNLRLDAALEPLPGSYLKSRVDVLLFEVVNADRAFPFEYVHPGYAYSVTLDRPGVIVIIRLHYPAIFNLLPPIVWEIKGTAELTY